MAIHANTWDGRIHRTCIPGQVTALLVLIEQGGAEDVYIRTSEPLESDPPGRDLTAGPARA